MARGRARSSHHPALPVRQPSPSGATNEHGELQASGLRFTSRLPPAWECWALWEPLPLDGAAAPVEDVTFTTPALRTAADMLGVTLAP